MCYFTFDYLGFCLVLGGLGSVALLFLLFCLGGFVVGLVCVGIWVCVLCLVVLIYFWCAAYCCCLADLMF